MCCKDLVNRAPAKSTRKRRRRSINQLFTQPTIGLRACESDERVSLLFFLFTALISLTRSHEQRLTPDFFLVSVVRRDSISFLFVLLSSPSILAADQSTKKKSARRRGQTNKREKENGESDSESRESRARVPLSLIDLALGALSVAVRSVSFSLSLFFSSSSILLSARPPFFCSFFTAGG